MSHLKLSNIEIQVTFFYLKFFNIKIIDDYQTLSYRLGNFSVEGQKQAGPRSL